ncbi:hypothetical protein GTY41_00410 [Streptomyces sp. SID685]|uniref:RICIN domain-containing protein n=1 Tax=Streptomyces TaxID=1883 RepID=UPI00136F0DC7|nr:hypothetical protein [Streptomyces sp. SID685]
MYGFQSRRTGNYLHRCHDTLVNHHGFDDRQPDQDAQWLIHPADQEGTWFWIVNRGKGGLLYGGNPGAEAHISRDALDANTDPYKWKFEPTSDGYYRIRARSTDECLHLTSDGFGAHVNVQTTADQFVEWKPVPVFDYPKVLAVKPVPFKHEIGDIDRLTSFAPPARETAPVLLGGVTVPSFLVNDGSQSMDWKAQHTPYYIIQRYGSWARTECQELPRASDGEVRRLKATVGLVKQEGAEVEKTLDISVTAEAGFTYAGASAKITSTVTAGLHTKTSTSTTSSHTKETEREMKLKAGRATLALWVRQDTYKLLRSNGDFLSSWTVRDPDIITMDSHQ